MIQENYVSFEQAKALKELGFPQRIGVLGNQFKDDPTIYYVEGEYYNKATLSLVQKWLREEKDIRVYVLPDEARDSESPWICMINDDILTDPHSEYTEDFWLFATYEEALSVGIDKCIELLKANKN